MEHEDNFARNSASLFLTEFVTIFVVDGPLGTGTTGLDGTEVPAAAAEEDDDDEA